MSNDEIHCAKGWQQPKLRNIELLYQPSEESSEGGEEGNNRVPLVFASGKAVTSGDSGSPVIWDEKIVGVVSDVIHLQRGEKGLTGSFMTSEVIGEVRLLLGE